MAKILNDNRTLTFGENEQFAISEKDLIGLIEEAGYNHDDVKVLVSDMIDALEEFIH